MPFINDLADRFAWAVPEPVGYVEPGWTAIALDLLHRIDGHLAAVPGATLDILDVSSRSGAMRFAFVVDGAGEGGRALHQAIGSVVAAAEERSRATCPHSGRHRSTSPTMRSLPDLGGKPRRAPELGR